MGQLTLFDYNNIDTDTRDFVQGKAQAINIRLKRMSDDAIATGLDLLAVKDALEKDNGNRPGLFMDWVVAHFPLSMRTAERWMQYAERFGDTPIAKLSAPSSVLTELLNSDDKIIEMIESGEIPATLPAIREAKRELQSPMPVTPPPPLTLPSSWTQPVASTNGHAEPVMDARTGETVAWIADAPPQTQQREALKTTLDTFPSRSISPDVAEQVTHREDTIVKEADAPMPVEDVKERRDAHVMQVMGSSESPEWYTPRAIVERVYELMGTIDLDPCSNSREYANVPATVIYTKEDDGLSQEWKGKTYLNPPYGAEISQWVNKLILAYTDGEVEEAVALLPGRIDTAWFQPLYEYLLCHVRGRIQFENSPHHCPFPCVIAYLGKREDAFIEKFAEMGPIMRRIG